MLFYIHYKRTFDETLFKLWLNHYDILNLPYNIYVEKQDVVFFTSNYPYTKNIINYIPDNITMLTEMDFLMSYSVNEHDIMVLSYNINGNEFIELIKL
jgi:predicted ATP-grasp superfamily ATP-dependent carboligase